MSQGGPQLILGSRGHGLLGKFEFVAGGGYGVPLKQVYFKWMWVGIRVYDIYVYTFCVLVLVYSLHHDQTVLKRTLSVKVRAYKEWLDK